jgi:hypothetical protein
MKINTVGVLYVIVDCPRLIARFFVPPFYRHRHMSEGN